MQTNDFIPFSSLNSDRQQRVWALATALICKDCLPLIKYFGTEGAKCWYDNLSAAVPERKTMISEYWHMFQKIPFAAAFVLDPTI